MSNVKGAGTVFDLIRCDDDAEWLDVRRKGIGGSDVAAILGVSPWRTPLDVWLDKTGRREPEDISERPYVRFGTVMEPYVGEEYKKAHPERTVRRLNAVCRSKERPWAQASLDYEERDPELGWGVLEIKTARSDADWEDGVPLYYQTQVMHYLTVTGRRFADVAVLFRDSCEVRDYRIVPDEEDLAAIEDAVDTFWADYVDADVAPAVMDRESGDSLIALHGTGDGLEQAEDNTEADEAIDAYLDAKQAEADAKARKDAAAMRLKGLIGSRKGIVTDTSRVTWVRSLRGRLDTTALKRDMPDVYAKYTVDKLTDGGIRVADVR